jgi:hypothetical protein
MEVTVARASEFVMDTTDEPQDSQSERREVDA